MRKKKSPKKGYWPKWSSHPVFTKTPEMTQNFIRGGIRGYLVPVFIPVRDIPPVPAGTKWNQ